MKRIIGLLQRRGWKHENLWFFCAVYITDERLMSPIWIERCGSRYRVNEEKSYTVSEIVASLAERCIKEVT